MSYVFASPEVLNAAAAEVSTIGSSLQTANAWAAAPTTALLSALGADEVSAVVTAMFGNHAQAYPAVSTQAAEFHDRSVAALSAGADAYSGAEASSAATLQSLPQDLLNVVNAPTQALLGRALIGNGANGADGTGQNGADGGLLWGNGGNGGTGAAGQAGGNGGAAGRPGGCPGPAGPATTATAAPATTAATADS